MEMTYRRDNRDLMIHFEGELDHHAAKEAMESIERWIDQNLPQKTVLDFSGLAFMDSSGIAVVLKAKRRMESLRGNLAVINIPRQAARVLDTAGLNRYIDMA